MYIVQKYADVDVDVDTNAAQHSELIITGGIGTKKKKKKVTGSRQSGTALALECPVPNPPDPEGAPVMPRRPAVDPPASGELSLETYLLACQPGSWTETYIVCTSISRLFFFFLSPALPCLTLFGLIFHRP